MPEGHSVLNKASVVKIDGPRVRELREALGLTQLYVATAVGVTTDTISRWENGRYPTIKKDNAERLAAALEVSLAEILEHEPQKKTETAETKRPGKKLSRVPLLTIGLACAAIIGILSVFYLFNTGASIDITARRILPDHAAPGQIFPVLVKVKTDNTKPLSFILREILPRQCRPLKAVPSYTTWDDNKRSLKWIYHSRDNEITFFYLGRINAVAPLDSVLEFSGTVTVKKGKKKSRSVEGCKKLEIKPLHWADTNQDGQIDDEEILAVYEEFGEIKDADFGLDQIEAIWAGSGYKWDQKTKKLVIFP